MALAPPRKKKIIIIIIILSAKLADLFDHDEFNTPEEQFFRLVGRAEYLMNEWDEDEGNWSTEQNTLADLLETIADAHDPNAMGQPVTSDYERWAEDLDEAILAL